MIAYLDPCAIKNSFGGLDKTGRCFARPGADERALDLIRVAVTAAVPRMGHRSIRFDIDVRGLPAPTGNTPRKRRDVIGTTTRQNCLRRAR